VGLAHTGLAQDWICEVLSPSTAGLDRDQKWTSTRAKVSGHAWLIEVQGRTLEVYRNHAGAWLRIGEWHDDATVAAEPLDAVSLPLGVL
jgi:Uma2 family endonuclease